MLEWLIPIMYWSAGFTLKLGDDLLDLLKQPRLSLLPLGFSGFSFGLLMSYSEWDLVLLTAILIGVVVSGKVNRPQFLIGFILIGVILLLNGVPVVSDSAVWFTILVVLLLAAVVDEIQNERVDSNQETFVSKFFRYRFTLKVVVLGLCMPWPSFLLAAIGLWVFDFGYELAGWLVGRSRAGREMQDYSIRQQRLG